MKTQTCILMFLLILVAVSCDEKPTEPFIAVNLVGYHPDFQKEAFLINMEIDSFSVINAETLQAVYTGKTGDRNLPDPATGDHVTVLDFSDFKNNGTFFVSTTDGDAIVSHPFSIEDEIYSDAVLQSIKSFYYHRCGTSVRADGEWGYHYCHLDDAPHYKHPEVRVDVTGGWHDAGDYNKFSVNTALSAGLLLYLFDHKPDAFFDNQLGIPESGNGMPDLLDEIAYGMQWLMKMQRNDGAVYHKVSQKKWIGEYLPHEDPSVRYLFETSTTATASFTAVSALAARVFDPYDKTLADQLRNSAMLGWEYLQSNPIIQPLGGFRNPPDVFGGEYGDDNDTDERLWAAIELYRLTGDDQYIEYFMFNHSKLTWDFRPLSWKNVHSLALLAFMEADLAGKYTYEYSLVKEAWISHANRIMAVYSKNNYKNLLRHTEYYWGSNSVGLGYAFDLIQVYRLTGQESYLQAVTDQLHYVLGRNPFNKTQVTGIGSRAVQHPYHQLSEMGEFSKPVPGMLVGGPNNYVYLRNRQISKYPGKNYEDRFQNYYVNEPAINFTAIFAYVSGMIAFHSYSNKVHTK